MCLFTLHRIKFKKITTLMEVSIVSGEFVVPSCATPKHPETHLLSFIDHFVPSIHVNLILFYSFGDGAVTNQSHLDEIMKRRLQSLKQSLAKTLVSFYPLAGRLSEDKNSIVCSDEGAYFVEATVDSTLSKFLQTPELFHKLVPAAATDNIVALTQVTRFTCGGMVICASVSHRIVDASSLSFFLRSWAATATDDREPYQLPAPNFDASTFFPPTETETSHEVMALLTPFLKRGFATKRFVFNVEAIVALKAKASNSTSKRSPTRVEVVSALIFKSIAAAMEARSGIAKPIYTTRAVNIRRRAMPSFPESSMGNYVGLAPATLSIEDQDLELWDLVIKMREAMTERFSSEFIKSLQSEPEKFWEIHREIGEAAERQVEYIGLNSWCNLGFYDVDFGWGKPMWMDHRIISHKFSSNVYYNYVFLMDTRLRDGVEAWITLQEEEMSILEQDKEFIASVASVASDAEPMSL